MRSRIALVTLIGLLAAALCCLATSTATAGVGIYGRSEQQTSTTDGIGELPRQSAADLYTEGVGELPRHRTADLPTEGVGELPRSLQSAVQMPCPEKLVKIALMDLLRVSALVP